jgi:hypothetical protein
MAGAKVVYLGRYLMLRPGVTTIYGRYDWADKNATVSNNR